MRRLPVWGFRLDCGVDATPRSRPSRRSNALEALDRTWSKYPGEWKHDDSLRMGVAVLGEEWGGPDFANAIVDELAAPFMGPDVDALELGCGGGKFSRLIRGRVRHLCCTDISAAMLAHAAETAGRGDDIDYVRLDGRSFAPVPDSSADFVFSYDMQLHIQPQNLFAYLVDGRRVLRPGGVFMVHAIDLDSAGGRDHFLGQYYGDTWLHALDAPRRRGHIYYMSEDQIRSLGRLAGYEVATLHRDWPGPEHQLRGVTRGRDTIAFLRRLPGLLEGSPRLVRSEVDVFIVIDDVLRKVASPLLERVGLTPESAERLPDAELDAMPVGEPVTEFEA